MSSLETKDRILDAAERLFAENGIGETSLRGLTSEAEVNLAAVHYHFGSKERLIQAVVARRFEPINAERMRLLDELEAAGGPIGLEALLGAFLGPPVHLTGREPELTQTLRKLIARIHLSGERWGETCLEVFTEVRARFGPAFARALPHLDAETLHWRVSFMVGVLSFTFADPHSMEQMSGGVCQPGDTEQTLGQMIAFVAAGMRAPGSARVERPA